MARGRAAAGPAGTTRSAGGGAQGTGAPRSNGNAVKHGRTTAAALAARRAIARLIRASRRTLEEMGG